MENQKTQQQIKAIYQMLFEMATGNLTFRTPQPNCDDDIERITSLLNSIAEELYSVILKSGYINPYYSYQNLVHVTLLLDINFKIKSFSSDVPTFMNYTADNLFEMDFQKLLSTQSQYQWEQIKKQLVVDNNFHTTLQLIFITPSKQVMPSFCTISRLMYSNKFIISTITTVLQDTLTHSTGKINNNCSPRESDAALIQRVYEYILVNLEDPLPSAKELSIMFGTNEFKIKDSFRHFFNTSIYQFYSEERLKKAHLLIQQTSIPLNEIALMSGFTNYINFYKAFKKRFNYLPSKLKRNDIDNNEL